MQQKTEKVRTSFGFKKKAVVVAVTIAAATLGLSSTVVAYGEPSAPIKSADATERKTLKNTGAVLLENVESPSQGSVVVEAATLASTEPVAPPPPPPTIGAQALAVAYNYIGTPYVAYAAGPGGFDCSGLVMFSFAQIGVSVPHGANGIANMGTVIDASQAEPGDLVWYPGQHIGFWVSPGLMLDAPIPGRTVGVHQIWGAPLIVRL